MLASELITRSNHGFEGMQAGCYWGARRGGKGIAEMRIATRGEERKGEVSCCYSTHRDKVVLRQRARGLLRGRQPSLQMVVLVEEGGRAELCTGRSAGRLDGEKTAVGCQRQRSRHDPRLLFKARRGDAAGISQGRGEELRTCEVLALFFGRWGCWRCAAQGRLCALDATRRGDGSWRRISGVGVLPCLRAGGALTGSVREVVRAVVARQRPRLVGGVFEGKRGSRRL